MKWNSINVITVDLADEYTNNAVVRAVIDRFSTAVCSLEPMIINTEEHKRDFEHPLNMDTSEILKSIDQIELALEKAYNPNINTVNFEKFNKVLKQNGTDIQVIGKNLLNAGTSGQKAFLNFYFVYLKHI